MPNAAPRIGGRWQKAARVQDTGTEQSWELGNGSGSAAGVGGSTDRVAVGVGAGKLSAAQAAGNLYQKVNATRNRTQNRDQSESI